MARGIFPRDKPAVRAQMLVLVLAVLFAASANLGLRLGANIAVYTLTH